jgi:hypothetical protein
MLCKISSCQHPMSCVMLMSKLLSCADSTAVLCRGEQAYNGCRPVSQLQHIMQHPL